MPSKPKRHTSPGKQSRAEQRSVEAKAYRPWYWTARWRRKAKRQLAEEPLCEECKRRGMIVAAFVCDHVEPHRGDEDKFWNGEVQSLCKSCHSGAKQSEERTGKIRPIIGLDGWPAV